MVTKEIIKHVWNEEIRIYEKLLEEKEQELNNVEKSIVYNEAGSLIYEHMKTLKKGFVFRTINNEEQQNMMAKLKEKQAGLKTNIQQIEDYLEDLKEININEIEI